MAQSVLSPLLATPHVAVALGLSFVIAPSGWLVRLVSPRLTGWERPPNIAIVHDPWGLSFVPGLLLKEVPYLMLMTVAALGQVKSQEIMAVARSVGYTPVSAWLKTVLPQIYSQIRLPVYAVLAFSLSVVDVAVIPAPTTPAPLSTVVFRMFMDRDLSMVFPASAGACLQPAVVFLSICAWRVAEKAVAAMARPWLTGGRQGSFPQGASALWGCVFGLLVGLSVLGTVAMTIWSFAETWFHPSALPASWSLAHWARHLDGLIRPGKVTRMQEIGLIPCESRDIGWTNIYFRNWLIQNRGDAGSGMDAMSDTAEKDQEIRSQRPKYLYGEILSRIRQMIDSGELGVGDRLPPERTLAAQFKVSRNSVRQAIQALAEKGILESRQGDGTYVCSPDAERFEGALAAAIQAQKESLREIMEFRLLVEPQVAALAARRITRAQLERLKIIVCDQERRNLAGECYGDLDAAFHFEVAKAAGNRVLLRVVKTIMEIVNESRAEPLQSPERRRLSVVGHLELITALESGDAETAASAMRAHLRSVEQVLLGGRG